MSTKTKNEKWDEKFNIFRCLLGERKFGESTLLRARSFMDFPTLLKILLILVVITCFGLIIWASSSNKKTQKSIHIDDYQVRWFIFIYGDNGLWSFKLEDTKLDKFWLKINSFKWKFWTFNSRLCRFKTKAGSNLSTEHFLLTWPFSNIEVIGKVD